MAGYKDSGVEWIGAIPKEWKFVPLKDSFYFVAGGTPLSNVLSNWDEGVAWVTPADFKTDKMYISKGARSLSKKGYQSCNAKMLPPGSIIFSKRAPIGSVAINTAELCTNQGCIGLLNKTKNANNKYFYYILSIATQTFEEISIKNFGNVSLPLPPIHEQQRIADFLDAKCGILDRTIDAVSRQIEDLEKYKKALITKTVTKGICKKDEPERAMKDSGVEWIGEVPEEWNVKPFKTLAGMKGSSEYTARDIVDEDEGVILLSPSNINDNKLNLSKRTYISQKKYDKSTTKIQRGDLLFTKTASVGKCVIYDSDEPAMPNPQLVVLKNIKCLPKFLYYSMVSDVMQAPTKMYVYGSVIPTISQLNLGRIKIPVPSPEEQQQIADYLDEKCKNIDNRVQKRRQQLEWLKEYKKSLIFDYVTGKKRV